MIKIISVDPFLADALRQGKGIDPENENCEMVLTIVNMDLTNLMYQMM